MAAEMLEAVLPLKSADMSRSAILRASLDQFFPRLARRWVVAPDGIMEVARRAFPADAYTVISENSLLPELRQANERPHGWRIQQMIKLAIAKCVESSFYLTLDADVICVQPLEPEDLFIDGRAIANLEGPGHRDWYEVAGEILGLPASARNHCVTPAILSREGSLALQAHIGADWVRVLIANNGWSEYALYNTFLEAAGLYDRHHVVVEMPRFYRNDAWYPDQLAVWDPAESFAPGGPLFTVVQSNTGVTAEEVVRRVKPWLDVDLPTLAT
jgi:uncharacterized protein DUF6492